MWCSMSTAALSGCCSRARPPCRVRKRIFGLWRQKRRTMRHLKSGSKLGRNPVTCCATLRNWDTNLLEHGRITTTLTARKDAAPGGGKDDHPCERDTLQARCCAVAGIMTPAVNAKAVQWRSREACRSRWRLARALFRRHPRGRWRKRWPFFNQPIMNYSAGQEETPQPQEAVKPKVTPARKR